MKNQFFVLTISMLLLSSCTTVQRPQTPKEPFNYDILKVNAYNSIDDISMDGVLTPPSNRKNYPAVILVSGSGPHNYDEEWVLHKPFAVIADFLTENGIAVLRLNDREYDSDPELFYQNTTEDFVRDLDAAVKFLKSFKDTRNSPIGIIGHSEGGITGAMAAAENADISFLITVGTPAMPLKDYNLIAAELSYRLARTDEAELANLMHFHSEYNEIVENYKNRKQARAQAEELYDRFFKDTDAYDRVSRYNLSTRITLPWYRYMYSNDPSVYMQNLHIPVLAVYGGFDSQVPPDENLKAAKIALSRNWNEKSLILKMVNLNHMMQPADSFKDYPEIDETVSIELLHEMVRWINTLGF